MSSEVIQTIMALAIAFSILAVLMVSSLIQIVLKGRRYRILNGLLIAATAVGFFFSLFALVFPATGNPVDWGNLSPGVNMPGTHNTDH